MSVLAGVVPAAGRGGGGLSSVEIIFAQGGQRHRVRGLSQRCCALMKALEVLWYRAACARQGWQYPRSWSGPFLCPNDSCFG